MIINAIRSIINTTPSLSFKKKLFLPDKISLQQKYLFYFLVYITSAPPCWANQSQYLAEAQGVISQLQSNYIHFQGYKNHYYSHKKNRNKALVIITGVAEPAIKYWQLFSVFQNDYDIYFWDHVGQGKSPRLIPTLHYKKVHIDSFTTYQETLNHFLGQLNQRYNTVHAISHSMGSHIAMKQLLIQPESIDKLVAITPMIDINRRFIPRWLAHFILNNFYSSTDWAPLQKDENPDSSYFTGAKDNFDNYQKLIDTSYPKQKSTGVTAGWLRLAINSIDHLLSQDYSSIKTPILLVTAGRDTIVKSKAAQSFCKKLTNCNHRAYKKGKHQLLIETDAIRFDIYKNLKLFFMN